MNHFVKLIVIALVSFGLMQILPFWSVAVAGFLASLFIKSGNLGSFLTGFLAVFLLWGGMAYLINMETAGVMTEKISQLFSMSPPLMILLTGVIGGITAGLGSLAGNQLRLALKS